MPASKPDPPTLTIDCIIFQMIDGDIAVLTMRVASDPHRGEAALPGGFCAKGETTRMAMDRILQTKAGLRSSDVGLVEQLYTFDTVEDTARGHAVSVTYLGLCHNLEPLRGDTTQSPAFVKLSYLPALAYDQRPVVDYALIRLRSKLTYTTAAASLLPDTFTIFMLHALYETVLDYQLDIRNFRKKFLSYGVLERTDQMYKSGQRRPAYLYKFKSQALQTLNRDF